VVGRSITNAYTGRRRDTREGIPVGAPARHLRGDAFFRRQCPQTWCWIMLLSAVIEAYHTRFERSTVICCLERQLQQLRLRPFRARIPQAGGCHSENQRCCGCLVRILVDGYDLPPHAVPVLEVGCRCRGPRHHRLRCRRAVPQGAARYHAAMSVLLPLSAAPTSDATRGTPVLSGLPSDVRQPGPQGSLRRWMGAGNGHTGDRQGTGGLSRGFRSSTVT